LSRCQRSSFSVSMEKPIRTGPPDFAARPVFADPGPFTQAANRNPALRYKRVSFAKVFMILPSRFQRVRVLCKAFGSVRSRMFIAARNILFKQSPRGAQRRCPPRGERSFDREREP